jgi:hypothetical protein
VLQEAFHDAHTNASEWPAVYCRLRGSCGAGTTMRSPTSLTRSSSHQPGPVSADADNFITNIHVCRRSNSTRVLLRACPAANGVGFWDGDAFIT